MMAQVDFVVFNNIVDGQKRGAEKSYYGINPATEERLFDAPVATESDLNDAVDSAQKAFPSWSRTPYEKRCEVCYSMRSSSSIKISTLLVCIRNPELVTR